MQRGKWTIVSNGRLMEMYANDRLIVNTWRSIPYPKSANSLGAKDRHRDSSLSRNMKPFVDEPATTQSMFGLSIPTPHVYPSFLSVTAYSCLEALVLRTDVCARWPRMLLGDCTPRRRRNIRGGGRGIGHGWHRG